MDKKNYESPQLHAVELEIEQAILQASDQSVGDFPGWGDENEL